MCLFYSVICYTEVLLTDYQLKNICKFLCCVIWKINPIWYSAFQSFISLHKCFHSFIVSCKNDNHIFSLIFHFLKQHCNSCVTLHSIRFIYEQNTSSCCQKCFSDSTYASYSIQIHSSTLNKCTTF